MTQRITDETLEELLSYYDDKVAREQSSIWKALLDLQAARLALAERDKEIEGLRAELAAAKTVETTGGFVPHKFRWISYPGQGGNLVCENCDACYCCPPWTLDLAIQERCLGKPKD